MDKLEFLIWVVVIITIGGLLAYCGNMMFEYDKMMFAQADKNPSIICTNVRGGTFCYSQIQSISNITIG